MLVMVRQKYLANLYNNALNSILLVSVIDESNIVIITVTYITRR